MKSNEQLEWMTFDDYVYKLVINISGLFRIRSYIYKTNASSEVDTIHDSEDLFSLESQCFSCGVPPPGLLLS